MKGEAEIGEWVGRNTGKYKMAKHFEWAIDENGFFGYRRNAESIPAEAALDGWPVQCFRALLGDLATVTKKLVVPRMPDAVPFDILTRPTDLQREAFRLLGLSYNNVPNNDSTDLDDVLENQRVRSGPLWKFRLNAIGLTNAWSTLSWQKF